MYSGGFVAPAGSPKLRRSLAFPSGSLTKSKPIPGSTTGNNHRPVSYQQQPYVSSVQKPSRRGRPMKVTSTSKMAKYARSYREQKKNQLLAYEARIKDLTEENEFLRSEHKRLSERFARLTEQVNRLRKTIDRNSYTYRDPLQTPHFTTTYRMANVASFKIKICKECCFVLYANDVFASDVYIFFGNFRFSLFVYKLGTRTLLPLCYCSAHVNGKFVRKSV
ncbi:unnamed protein product [Angiostrongylus costaricensis]|uniref:BZIP domain-containing protein n=1 Tax=Angiostrongylus costaricensis TaxID=334426 RepID=A0A0R3PAW3_ANGCS|nr:unnamed protein product [Angiostrongylus costaricensis]